MKIHRVLIVGAGHAGVDLHFQAYSKLENVEVPAFCDVDRDAVKAVCARHNIKGCYTDLEKAIDETTPDIISVTTPPATHFEIAKKGLESGAVVIVEKPIFMNLEEAEEIRKTESASNGRIVPVHNQVSFGGTRKALDLFKKGELGEIVHVNAYWMNEGRENEMTKNPEHWSHSLPGGRWEELIPHRIYIPYRFVGKMELLHVDLIKTERSLPWLPGDEVLAVLKSKTGFVTIRLSANTRRYNYYELYGRKNNARVVGNSVELWESGEPAEDARFAKKACDYIAFMKRKLKNKIINVPEEGSRVKQKAKHLPFLSEVIDAVSNKAEMPVSWDEALDTLELTMEIGREIGRQWKSRGSD